VADARQRGRARPVADAPVAALIAGADDVARDWLLALLGDGTLAAAASVPVADLAREGPGLCAAIARALADDAALDRLARGDLSAVARRAGAIAGARDAAAAVTAVDALRAAVWAAALDELRRPDPRLVADLADRLAAVAAVVTAAAVAGLTETAAAATPAPPPPPEPVPAPEPARWDPDGAARSVERAARRAEPPAAVVPPAADPGEVHVADLRPRIVDGDPLAHLADRVAEHLDGRRSLAVLLVELDGIERLLAAGGDAEAAVAAAEQAVEGMLRQGDSARREAPGRIWIALPGTGPAGARALALRIAVAVERAAVHRGVPLTASVGSAAFPVDATDAAGLADRAEEALYAARAGGV